MVGELTSDPHNDCVADWLNVLEKFCNLANATAQKRLLRHPHLIDEARINAVHATCSSQTLQ